MSQDDREQWTKLVKQLVMGELVDGVVDMIAGECHMEEADEGGPAKPVKA